MAHLYISRLYKKFKLPFLNFFCFTVKHQFY